MLARRTQAATASRQASAAGRLGAGARWAVAAYVVVLVVFTVFVLLDTFAIQRVESHALAADTTSIQAAQSAQAQDAQDSQGSQESQAAAASEEAASAATAGVSYSSHGEGRSKQGTGSEKDAPDAASQSAATDSPADEAASSLAASTQDASEAAAGSSASFTQAQGDVVYADENMQITLSTSHVYDTDVYIADVQVSSAEYLKTAFAQDAFGRNIKEATSDMAVRTASVLAINGDYYGFRDDGYVIRNGVLYRDTPAAGTDALVVYGDGTMAAADQSQVSAQQLLDSGAWQVFSFGPVLLQEGQVMVAEGEEVGQAKASNPRTAIGMVSPLHYIVVVSDGRTDASAGLSLHQLAQVMADAGATFAYNLDGGGSTTLCLNGEIVNNPTGGRGSSERKVSDIVYFG